MARPTPCEVAREAMFVTLGLAVLAFQRAQVRRRELAMLLRRLGD